MGGCLCILVKLDDIKLFSKEGTKNAGKREGGQIMEIQMWIYWKN